MAFDFESRVASLRQDVGPVADDQLDDIASLVGKAGRQLRQYQVEGVRWLESAVSRRKRGARGAILGDEMGLGKTIQLIAWMSKSEEGRFLVVCPLSMVATWAAEIRDHS